MTDDVTVWVDVTCSAGEWECDAGVEECSTGEWERGTGEWECGWLMAVEFVCCESETRVL